jgi:hypothetical protein
VHLPGRAASRDRRRVAGDLTGPAQEICSGSSARSCWSRARLKAAPAPTPDPGPGHLTPTAFQRIASGRADVSRGVPL